MSGEMGESERLPYFFLPRPEGQLKSMPVRFRWEVTRRHPAYGLMWESARDFFAVAKGGSTEDWEKRPLAATILNAIGVYGAAPDPRLEINELDERVLGGAWLSGSMTRVTLKSLVGRLIAVLEPSEFRLIMTDLVNAMESEETDDGQRLAGLLALQQFDESLDRTVPELLVSINPQMTNGIIKQDLALLLDDWRSRNGTTIGRDRSDKYSDYLAVWDCREGWEKGIYSGEREQTLKEVANQLEMSEENANKRYRRAFELISGRAYSPTMWLRIMGVVKLSRSSREELGRVAKRRPLKNRTQRDIPMSVISTATGPQGVVNGLGAEVSQAHTELRDLMIDIGEQLEAGKTNDEIQEGLGIQGDLNEFLDDWRARLG